MPEPIKPVPALTFGRMNWIFVPSFTDYTAPTATVVSGASSLDFTQIAFADGTARPTQTVNRVDAQRRFGDTKTFERRGAAKIAGGTINYALDPQAVAGTDAKKLWEKWLGGTSGFLVERLNVARGAAVATGQFVNVYPVDISESFIITSGDGEAGEVAGTADYFITSDPKLMVALA